MNARGPPAPRWEEIVNRNSRSIIVLKHVELDPRQFCIASTAQNGNSGAIGGNWRTGIGAPR